MLGAAARRFDALGAIPMTRSAARATSCGVLAAVRSAAILGIEAYDVTVEVDVAAGLPAWTIVGLASNAVKEARERVTAALANSGFALPSRRIVVNLSPARDARERSVLAAPRNSPHPSP